jgi:hypothetical protein
MNQTMTARFFTSHFSLFPRACASLIPSPIIIVVVCMSYQPHSINALIRRGNPASLAERMVESLTLNDKNDDDTNKENSVANDANFSIGNDVSITSTIAPWISEENTKRVRALIRQGHFELRVPLEESYDPRTSHQKMETLWRLVIDLKSSMYKDDSLVCMNFHQQRACLPIKFSCLLASHVKIHGGGYGRSYSMTLGDLDNYVIVNRIQVDYPDKNKAPIYGFELGLLGHSPDHPILLHGHFPNGNHISIQQFAKLAGLSVKYVCDKFGLLAAEETVKYDLFAEETTECTMCPEELIPVDLEALEEAYGLDFEVHLFDIRCPFGVIRNTYQFLLKAEPRLSLSRLFDFNFAKMK